MMMTSGTRSLVLNDKIKMAGRMYRNTCFSIFLFLFFQTLNGLGQLKSVVYDFDGFDVGQTNVPEGDYGYGDLTYRVAANPLSPSEMIGDRVLQLNLKWNVKYGSFGRGISRFIEFDPTADILNFYFYNPVENSQSAIFDVNLGDDDNN